MNVSSQQKEEDDLIYKQITIKHRSNGYYEVRYRRNGYNKSFYGKTEQEAKVKFKEWYNTNFKNSKIETNKLETKNITVTEWVQQWLITYKQPNVKESTYNEIKIKVEKYIVKLIGEKKLKEITNIDIQKIYNNATFRGNPQNKVFVYCNNIFEIARINKLIKFNPCEGAQYKKHQDINSIAMTKIEQEEFKQAIKGCKYEKYYLFMLYTGCRRSEALAIKLSDIKDEKIHVKGTKTEKSDRYIPYFENVKELLKNCKEEIIFNFTPQTVTRFFKNYAPTHTLRDLRKTFATNCHEKGISPKVVQKWLGHTNISMTMNVYTDVTNDFELSELKKM